MPENTSETYEQKVKRLVQTKYTPEGRELVQLMLARAADLTAERDRLQEQLAEAEGVLLHYAAREAGLGRAREYLDSHPGEAERAVLAFKEAKGATSNKGGDVE